jgi:hypothetical protein
LVNRSLNGWEERAVYEDQHFLLEVPQHRQILEVAKVTFKRRPRLFGRLEFFVRNDLRVFLKGLRFAFVLVDELELSHVAVIDLQWPELSNFIDVYAREEISILLVAIRLLIIWHKLTLSVGVLEV